MRNGVFGSRSLILAFSELANNPNKYSGQVVRMSAMLGGFIHGRVLYDPNCSSIQTQAAVFYRTQNQEAIKAVLRKPGTPTIGFCL